MKSYLILLTTSIIIFTSACKVADIRTEPLKSKAPEATEEKGRALLSEAVEAMGYNKIQNFSTYQAHVRFKWKFPWNAMPMNAFRGSGRNGKKDHIFKFATNTFDGTITYLEGRKKGDVHGVQSFEAYHQSRGNEPKFRNDSRRTWGTTTWHYMMEAPYRILHNAPIIKYAGKKSFEGVEYDLVFATWGDENPNRKYDQWLLYINPETKFVDLSHVTVREFYMPMPKSIAHGTVRFLNRTESSSGVYFPGAISLQMFRPKDLEKFVYQVQLSDIEFDTFPDDELYVKKGLSRYYDNTSTANHK